MVVASLDIGFFSVYPYRVLVEGYITRNKVFAGLVNYSEIDRRTKTRKMYFYLVNI